jgi:hypothetical protein
MTKRTFAQCLESFADLPKPLALYCAHVARQWEPNRPSQPAPPLQFDAPLFYINTARATWDPKASHPEIMRHEDWPFQF